MLKLIRAIKHNDPSIRSGLEILFYPGLWAILFHRLANGLYKIKLFLLARIISQLSRWLTGIEIHPGARIGHGVFIDHGAGVVLGETCEVGDNTVIFHGVTLGGTGKDKGKRHPTIGKNVIIGAGTSVLGPITVGEGAKIGAGAIVIKDVPAGHTIVSEPSRDVNLEQSLRQEIELLKQRIEILERQGKTM